MMHQKITSTIKLAIGICFLLLAQPCKVSAQIKYEKAIRNLLALQTIAWNQGNLEAFMQGYWKSDLLIFIGKNGPQDGYTKTLANYKKSDPDTAAMGQLHFNLLELKPLSSQYYFVIGKWHLQRTVGDKEGHFTLLFRKIKGQWFIVADHSS